MGFRAGTCNRSPKKRTVIILMASTCKINPTGSEEISTYCDMSRDGGGWTLLVASHTNSWTKRNVYLRSQNTPTLNGDFSILEHADNIKNNINVAGSRFEYRFEAQKPGTN